MNLFDKIIKCDLGFLPLNEITTEDGFYKYINWWSCQNPESIWFTKFLRFYGFKAKKINFYSVFGSPLYIRRRAKREKDSINIFFTGENLSDSGVSRRFRRFNGGLTDVMDLSLGFQYEDNKLNYMRFPLWIIYVFSPCSTYEDIKKRVADINALECSINGRTIDCSIIARHDFTGIRQKVCDRISEFIPVTYEGKWRNNSNLLKVRYDDNKLKYLSNVKFNICPENSNEKGYVTEKIFESFLAKSIPIYWGAEGSPEEGIVNKEALLYWDDSKYFYDTLELLYKNKEAYMEFVSQPRLNNDAPEKIWNYFQLLNEKIQMLVE